MAKLPLTWMSHIDLPQLPILLHYVLIANLGPREPAVRATPGEAIVANAQDDIVHPHYA